MNLGSFGFPDLDNLIKQVEYKTKKTTGESTPVRRMVYPIFDHQDSNFNPSASK